MRLADLIAPDLEEVLRTDPQQVVELADELHAADLADVIEGLPDNAARTMIGALPVKASAEAFDAMGHARRAVLFESLERPLAASIADRMSPDERADLFQSLPDDVRADVLGRMHKDEARDVRELVRYPETSAGGIMTTEFVALAPELTAALAIEEVRRVAADIETVYEAYAVDPNGTLLGAVSLRELVIAPADRSIAAIMTPDVVSVGPETDQEEVARVFQRYGFVAVPVVDAAHKILGIVTVDDVVDILKQEQAEDIQKLGAVAPTDGAYFQTDFWTFVKKRAGWLVVIFLGEILTASVIEHYEGAIAKVAALVVFVPLIISSGGNTGSQASSLVIRGLALGEFGVGDATRILVREMRMGLVLGSILGVIGLLRALLVGHSGGGGLAAAVGLALVAVVTFGSVVGAGMPLLIRRIGFDPAVSSGPFIASLVDVLGIVIYFKVAMTLLGI